MADEADPDAIAEATASFRDQYDDGEHTLETVLSVDDEYETWTFDDLPLDSGIFGELVSRGIVRKRDGEYRISSREGVRAGLEGRAVSTVDQDDPRRALSSPIALDVRAGAALVCALAFLFGMRVLNYRSVVRGEHVVSPANDPYYYRYWMETLLSESDGITDTTVVTDMPDAAASRRPLTHASNWALAELLGGDQWAADMVAAWLPVVATLALGIVVYWLALIVTDDTRVGIASVGLLALTPVHAVYTSIGFLEHRPYQYLWIGVTILSLAWLAVDVQRRRERASRPRVAIREHLLCPWTWIAAIVLGIALAFSVHSWGGSILLFVPLGAYAGLKIALDVRAGLPPMAGNAPLLVGVGIGGAITVLLHVRWGWHEPFTAVVSSIVVVGIVAVAAVGELWHRLEWPTLGILAFEGGIAAVGVSALWYLRPDEWTRLEQRAEDLFAREGATETGSLFTTENAVVLEPMAQLGPTFYIAIAVLGWAAWTVSRRYDPAWGVLAVYSLFWLVLAAFQVRFAAQLSIVVSVLGGLGLVHLLAWLDLVRTPVPFRESTASARDTVGPSARDTAADGGDREPSIALPEDGRTLGALIWIALLVCGLSLIFVPTLSAQTVHSDAQFEAAMAIDDHAADRETPKTFVLSEWGDNRMYNYFVSGESSSYWYASRHFEEFRTGGDPDGWYEEFNESDVGYVVLTEAGGYDERNAQRQLHDELGTGSDGETPLEHYQAVYVDDEVTAFAVVPGATITADGEPGEELSLETEVPVSGETVTYERTATVDDDGTLAVTVPYPGEYTVGEREIDVPARAVETGSVLELEQS
ncbi:MFS transporter [Natrarchaeobius halalkaliphilus]|uniref:dolichyl-phosphooligosaccharide-protein glycotransferase n=1 Tax=Natrarchaeobius halalkaliphilus TaxID=1679091 RepID=A0A3N6M644_9EURY|nr:MFS transporter [Natrarchaeobius halalkaliphilus]RQG91510.1 MFS transporter [Natrarchaeobius halalkaliphilus]